MIEKIVNLCLAIVAFVAGAMLIWVPVGMSVDLNWTYIFTAFVFWPLGILMITVGYGFFQGSWTS